jgi:glutaredoxin
VKEFLSRAGHRFTVRNVDEEHDAYTELLALGVRTVPATVIGSTVVKGFDPPTLEAALAGGGESRPDR